LEKKIAMESGKKLPKINIKYKSVKSLTALTEITKTSRKIRKAFAY